jgi:CDP-diglyceride synthetase
MTESTPPTPQRAPLYTIWDAVTALAIGVVVFVMSIFHQEELWVCFLSGGIVAVIAFVTYPLLRRLVRR